MTDQELIEWHYRYEERLGILCGTTTPIEEQKRIAWGEATAAIKNLQKPLDQPLLI